MMDQRRHTADQMASHRAELEQLAKQMADMHAFMQATITSKDVELASAKVATDKANAEVRDAAGQVNAETAAAKSWQNRANDAQRALEDVQAQRARDAEIAKRD